MYAHDPKLLNRIEAFDIDGRDAAIPFDRRLARECHWSVDFARRVVREYRRFVYLAMTAGHPVTPSDEVDQAWHLHLVYTDGYWRRMCGEVLPRPLHHNPTAGGQREDAKFNDWYERTRESYRMVFGHEPPRDIWPPAGERFDPKRQFQRVRNTDCLIVSKRALRRGAIGVGGVAAVPLLLGATILGVQRSGADEYALVIVGVALLVGVGLMFAAIVRRSDGSNRGRSDGSGGCGGVFGGCGGGGSLHDGGNSGGDGGGDGGSGSGCGGGGGCGGSGCGGGD